VIPTGCCCVVVLLWRRRQRSRQLHMTRRRRCARQNWRGATFRRQARSPRTSRMTFHTSTRATRRSLARRRRSSLAHRRTTTLARPWSMVGSPAAEATGPGVTLSGDAVVREAVEAETHQVWRYGAVAFGCRSLRTASLMMTLDNLESIDVNIGRLNEAADMPGTDGPRHRCTRTLAVGCGPRRRCAGTRAACKGGFPRPLGALVLHR
jgi:hypothetical protein